MPQLATLQPRFGHREPGHDDPASGFDDFPVGVMTFEVRNQEMLAANRVWFRYHTICFHKVWLMHHEHWYIERVGIIMMEEARQARYVCALCDTLLYAPVL
jgi:hypothetical protein